MIEIRKAQPSDNPAIWGILKPVFRAGDTYAISPDIGQVAALDFWCGNTHTAYVAIENNQTLGSYYICPNQSGGGTHVCNCGFATSPAARGKGVARKMLAHALDTAQNAGYLAMQFNFVVETNLGALKIWADNGFETVGRLPKAFNHPSKGYVDALVLYKTL